MHRIANLEIPLLERHPADLTNSARQDTAAPAPSLLVRLSRTPIAKLLGCHQAKYFAGVMVGIGIMLLPMGGLGIGFIIAGSALWAASTTLSTTALHDKSFNSIYFHLATSAFSGGLGIGMGTASVALAGMPQLAHGGWGAFLAMITVAATAGFPRAIDHVCDQGEALQVIEHRAGSLHTTLKNDTINTLRRLFNTHQQATVQLHNPRRDITFVMEDNQDKLTCSSIMESNNHWIAVERTPSCYDLFEMSSFYNEQGQPHFTRHPYTRKPLHENMIISGQPLLDLLLAAQTSESELPALSVSPEYEDWAISNNG